jgi:hypothetical protein
MEGRGRKNKTFQGYSWLYNKFKTNLHYMKPCLKKKKRKKREEKRREEVKFVASIASI